MPLTFEPVEFFKRGVHHAIEIDPEKLTSLREPLNLARTYGQPEPLIAWIRTHQPDSIISADEFYASDDGYPTSAFLKGALLEALRREDTEDFGLGIHGAIQATELSHGETPFDVTAPVSAEWLKASPELDFLVCSAEALFHALDFTPQIDEDAISDVTDTYDRGGMERDVSAGDFLSGPDPLEEWKRELAKKLAVFYDQVEEMAGRGAWVATWYEGSFAP